MEFEELNRQLRQLYNSAEAASSEGLADEAIKRCESAMELLDHNVEEDSQFSHTDFLLLAGHACWHEGDYEGAMRYYRQGYELDPGRLDALVATGVSLFFICRFAASKTYLELASVEDPDCGEVWYYLALIARREEKHELAFRFFEKANELEPERWLRPEFLPLDDIQDIVEHLFGAYPPEIREALSNVAIVLEERPTEEFLFSSEPPHDPLLLGIFEGVPLPEQSVFDPIELPCRIVLYAENIALIAADKQRLVEELAVTLKHEIGHFLGLDEDELASRGLD